MLLSRPAYAPRGPVRLLLVMPSLMLLVCGCFSGTDETPSSRSRTAPVQDEGTRRMVVALQQIYEEAVQNPRPYFHLNHLRAEGLRRTVDTLSGPDQEAMRFYYAGELLNAGESNATIRELNRVIKTMKFSADEITRDSKPVYEMLALANLRLGEQQNCLEQHAAQACILPLIDGGIHSRQRGSRRAITIYSRLLEHFPDDYQSRWLLNVAYMTLGEYPEGVPAPWRIEGIEARARPLLPRFPNIAVELGIDVDEISGGVSVDDFNNDGLLDLFVTSYGLNDAARLFLSDSRGGFVDHTEAAGLTGISSGLNVVHADYNNDGFVDIFILRGAWLGKYGKHPNSLLRNNGDGTFNDVTFAAGLASYHPTQTAAWGDVNNDGFLDLFIGNETSQPSLTAATLYGGEDDRLHPSELYLNNGDDTFTNVAEQVGLNLSAFVKGVAWGDVNNDGWDDLLVLPYDMPLLSHAGSDVAREYLGRPPVSEMPRLYRNEGDETFTDVTGEAGLNQTVLYAMGSNYGDLNNDGFPDAYVGTGSTDLRSLIPNRMFLNEGGVRFKDVTFDGGFGHLQKGHGVAFADFDRDGDQDVYAVMGGAVEGDVAANVLFDNPGVAPDNAWVTLLLEGKTANRSAIGARIRVSVTRRDGSRQVFYGTVSTGGSFGASSLQQEMGLGEAVQIDTLQITWPNRQRTVETHTDVPIRRSVRIVEGQAPVVLNRPPVAWRAQEPHRHH